MKFSAFWVIAAWALWATLSSCASVQFQQKERLADPIMIFDRNPALAEMQANMRGPREASVGGTSSHAGGCSCK